MLKGSVRNWLIAETPELDFWNVRLQLYRCPSCSTFWLWCSHSHGHQDWDQRFSKIVGRAEFDSIVVEEGRLKETRLADLKLTYEKNGWQWKW